MRALLDRGARGALLDLATHSRGPGVSPDTLLVLTQLGTFAAGLVVGGVVFWHAARRRYGRRR